MKTVNCGNLNTSQILKIILCTVIEPCRKLMVEVLMNSLQ